MVDDITFYNGALDAEGVQELYTSQYKEPVVGPTEEPTEEPTDEPTSLLATLTFDSEDEAGGIVELNKDSNNSSVVTDATRGNVLSLGAGDAAQAMSGVKVTNPFATKTTTADSIMETYNNALFQADYSELTEDDLKTYNADKDAAYDALRPQWDAEDGVTLSTWVNVPEGTASGKDGTADSGVYKDFAAPVLLAFYNDQVISVRDGEGAYDNANGHFYVYADGTIEFRELSYMANSKWGSLEGQRNFYQSHVYNTDGAIDPTEKAGEWMCVTLVIENDGVTVYFDGVEVNSTVESVSNSVDSVKTGVQAFNGYFGAAGYSNKALVEKSVFTKFPTYATVQTLQGMGITVNYADYSYKSPVRISLVDWLKDANTELYVGGTAGRDTSYDGAWALASVNGYTVQEGTMIDDLSFYSTALTAEEVAAAYNAGLPSAE